MNFNIVFGQIRVGIGAIRRSGVVSSLLGSRAVDVNGEPIPWLTYSAIHQLEDILNGSQAVVEFGSGQSSLWFAKRARSVVSIETDPAWAERVESMARERGLNNVNVRVSAEFDPVQFGQLIADADIILIDGPWRRESAELARARCKPGAYVVIDNTDPGAGGYGLPELFEGANRTIVKFRGLGPCLLHEWNTTICFPEWERTRD
ncbi:class I SAM-dependent methyltransferase [Roseimicrobium sp. ORNL1]|uniref:class I SAM-dependent methyltransferase n=1 Tax=Roseimicrobium sp. ORNL1 TaxID=2711231 RepID=UPI0013E20607|nr:class I SAM-dependent methyltransferase [Roseimicrobium sp. ORNL1]QIF02940.1 class I SAM-dependent methyltransferase [Roseimicrobium sp. ORNL1]